MMYLVEALQAVIEEIEDRMHDKLEDFKSSFFGSLGAASKKLDQATGQRYNKSITKDNPVMGFCCRLHDEKGWFRCITGAKHGRSPKQTTNKQTG